jgi:aldehyde:ferredoxin oxidoreductase
MILEGYGKALDVDLSTGKIAESNIDPAFAREFIGGIGFGCKIIYDEVGPGVDPFGPQNIIVFANGPLTGTRAPCAGRTEITTRHPLTGSIGSGNTGGMWGAAMKHAGFDLVTVRNKAARPVYIRIGNGSVEIRDAGHLWGKETRTTSDIIRQELSPQASVLTIGPAGENLVRYACPLNDYYHVAGRSGAGGVMGSKNLKAIAVLGKGVPKPAQPQAFREAVRESREYLAKADKAWWNPGANGMGNFYTAGKGVGTQPCKNYQTGTLPGWAETRGMNIARKYFTHKGGICYSCGMTCYNMMGEVKEGKYSGLIESNLNRPGIVSIFGAMCALDNLPAIWKSKERCQQLGLDYVSASGTIAFAMELFQRGIIDRKDTDGLELTWGNEDAVLDMLHKIAFREGFGSVLAEGSRKAAEVIGKGSEKYAMTVKGVEMFGNDPRADRKGWVLGSITNPRGDTIKSTHFMADVHNPEWWLDKFDMPDEVKREIYKLPPHELFSSWEGKAMMVKWFEDLHMVVDSLGLCFFASHMRLALGPAHLSRLFSTYTGLETSAPEMMKAGERIFNLFKAYTAREGLSRSHDGFPDRFYREPLPEGPSTGSVLSREKMSQVLDEYYEFRGWDSDRGIPLRERLIELGLADIADDLAKRGKLP